MKSPFYGRVGSEIFFPGQKRKRGKSPLKKTARFAVENKFCRKLFSLFMENLPIEKDFPEKIAQLILNAMENHF